MKVINTSGKRKTAIARATFREGKGRVRINSVPLEVYSNEIIRMKISEAIALAPGAIDNVDVDIEVSGGGVMGQAEAVRTALGRGILGCGRCAAAGQHGQHHSDHHKKCQN